MKAFVKRTFDIICSSVGLIILSPLFLVLSILIAADSRGGVFFRGERVGRGGETFRIFKFRSMIKDCEGKGKFNVSDNDERITRMGHFLRRSKLDEVAQLINVFIGDMSLVGPRPELKCYVDLYTEREMPILDLKPGITDWASITNSQQYIGFTKAEDSDAYYLSCVRPLKLELQLYYRYHNGFFSDLYCIIFTVIKVLTKTKKLPRDVQKIVDEHMAKAGSNAYELQ